MKRMFVLLMVSFVFFNLLAVSCDISRRGLEEDHIGDMAVYQAQYNLLVVNNAGVAVTIYGPGVFYQDDTDTSLSNVVTEELCRVESAGETTAEFTWSPKYSLYYSDDPDNPDPPAEEIKARFQPTTISFYFKLVFEEGDGEDVYIVGWPQTVDLSTEAKEEWDIIIPREKIIQYNFGYAENREVRIKDGFVYVPFTVKGAALTEYDFDSAYTVYGDAVLTINADDDISFETSGLSTEEAP
jgi:hypothetical protein